MTPRPRYHFTPARNWMNDPNGPIYLNGQWHLYFQYNPEDVDWGNMSWGHAVSNDLVIWDELPIALRADDTEECFSGCVVLDRGNTSGLGSGIDPLVAIYTSALPDGRQAQSLAASQDDGLTWQRYANNPVLDRGSNHFRDPKVFWFDSADSEPGWVMVCVEADQQRALFYRSTDLVNWRVTGEISQPRAPAHFWECPDLFPLTLGETTYWVLVVSVNPGGPGGGSATKYCVGDFDGRGFQQVGDWAWFDQGRDFYAATTFAEAPSGRRLAIAWMNNWDYAGSVPTSPWRGAMSLPRELTLELRDGLPVLIQSVPAEALAAIDGEVPGCVTLVPLAEPIHLDLGNAPRLLLDLAPEPGSRIRVDLIGSPDETLTLEYDVHAARLRVDRHHPAQGDLPHSFSSPIQVHIPLSDGHLLLELFIDTTSVEVLSDGGAVTITNQIFWSSTEHQVRLSANGSATLIRAQW